jgi:hypothetical protein
LIETASRGKRDRRGYRQLNGITVDADLHLDVDVIDTASEQDHMKVDINGNRRTRYDLKPDQCYDRANISASFS